MTNEDDEENDLAPRRDQEEARAGIVPPVQPPPPRVVRFNPLANVAVYDDVHPMRTRSHGPALEIPNVMRQPLETSIRERAEAQTILDADA